MALAATAPLAPPRPLGQPFAPRQHAQARLRPPGRRRRARRAGLTFWVAELFVRRWDPPLLPADDYFAGGSVAPVSLFEDLELDATVGLAKPASVSFESIGCVRP